MKIFRFIIIFPFVIFACIFFILYQSSTGWGKPGETPENTVIQSAITPSVASEKDEVPTIAYEGKIYAYSFFTVDDVSKVRLVQNFSEKLLSTDMAGANDCKRYINGNFYDTQNRPLGLWKNGSTILRKALANRTFNGFFSVNLDGSSLISFDEPLGAKLALQSGPMLLSDGKILPLRIQNDEGARRMIAAKALDDTLIFLTVYDPDATYNGPTLTELPSLLKAIADEENLLLRDAVNLDGGSASAFSNGANTLQELTSIGSMICMTD